MKRLFPPILRTFLVSCIMIQFMHAQKIDKTTQQAAQKKSIIEYTVSTNNLMSAWLRNDGLMDQGPQPGERLSFPAGAGTIAYSSSVIWSGVWNNPTLGNPVFAGGQTITPGAFDISPATIEGWIETPGTTTSSPIAVSTADPRVKIYRIRKDWQQFFDMNDVPIIGLSEIRREASLFFNESQPSPEQERQLILRYREDWENWPGDLGAPYYDLNGNGSWDSGIDEPGLDNADQVIWFVCNDLSTALSSQIFGSQPVGLELQLTQWSRRNGYQPPDASTLYRRYRLINKSGFDIKDMYFSQHIDPLIADFEEDLAGSDRSRQLAYGYSGIPIANGFSGFGTPALGVTLLQGPLVEAPGETARFDFRERQGYRNQLMSSFAWSGSNSLEGEDILTEEIVQDQTPLRWFNWLRGYLPEADTSLQIQRQYRSGPNVGDPTFFPLDGNPLLETGDLDATGNNSGIGDRVIFSNTGPFTLANSDTQEVIYALIAGYNTGQTDNLSGLEALFNFTSQLRQNWNPTNVIPTLSSETTAGPTVTLLTVSTDLTAFNNPSNIQVTCAPRLGSEASFSFPLTDDGVGDDSLAGDGIFTGQIEVTNRKYPFQGELSLTSGGQTRSFPSALENLSLRPDPRVTNLRVIYENGLQDLYLNNQEHMRLGFDLINADEANNISSIEFTELRLGQFNTIASSLAPGDTLQDNNLFLDMLGNNSNSVPYSYRIRFDGHIAYGQGAYPGVRWEPPGIWRQILDVDVVEGVDGTIEPTITDINFLTGHQYEISFYGPAPDTSLRWQLRDITEDEIKLTDQRVLDKENNVFPVLDGIEWKVFTPEPGILTLGGGEVGIVEIAYGGTPLDSTQWDDGAPFEGNSVYQALNSTSEYYISNGRSVPLIDLMERFIEYAVPDEYEMRFTTEPSLGVYGRNDNTIVSIPFELWNIGSETPNDPSDDVRMIPVLDANGAPPTANWNWGTGIDPKFGLPSSDLIFFYDPVDQSPGTASYDNFAAQCQADGGPGNIYSTRSTDSFFADYHGDIASPISYVTICDFAGSGTPPPAGTVIRFYTTKVSAPGDTARVLAPRVEIEPPPPVIPESFVLRQNFPNPFNPSTKIQLDLPEDTPVKLEIFNTLGQRVKKLVNGDFSAGEYEFRWDGRGDGGELVASGIYFYRVQAGTFNKTRRMLLLR